VDILALFAAFYLFIYFFSSKKKNTPGDLAVGVLAKREPCLSRSSMPWFPSHRCIFLSWRPTCKEDKEDLMGFFPSDDAIFSKVWDGDAVVRDADHGRHVAARDDPIPQAFSSMQDLSTIVVTEDQTNHLLQTGNLNRARVQSAATIEISTPHPGASCAARAPPSSLPPPSLPSPPIVLFFSFSLSPCVLSL
jgi:hypothetical protein